MLLSSIFRKCQQIATVKENENEKIRHHWPT